MQANAQDPDLMPYHQARNEQAMVHQSVGFARMHRRLATYASAASVGPGAANMLTGAALATANRLPALLLPSDTFATRVADPVLQQLEHPHDTSVSVNDAFRPLSRFFDRVQRPDQLYSIALAAMRVLTDPAETGAVTIALPEDVQAEARDVPLAFLAPREWHLRRPLPERGPLARAVQAIREARTPLIIAGGGVSTPRPRRRSSASPRPRASRSARRRPAADPSPGTTRSMSAASAPPDPPPRTASPPRPTS